MSLGYVEGLAVRYFEKKGYVVAHNIRFQPKKEKTGKSVAGWSDIDILALKLDEVIIIQCKSFLGTQRAEINTKNIMDWYQKAEEFLREDQNWGE